MARLIGINHVAPRSATSRRWPGTGDSSIRAAWPNWQLDGLHRHGDQFIALAAGRRQPPDQARYFGLVVDDKEGVRAALREAGLDVRESGSLDFVDPWGNHVQLVGYPDIQFTKAPGVLRAMGSTALEDRGGGEELRRRASPTRTLRVILRVT